MGSLLFSGLCHQPKVKDIGWRIVSIEMRWKGIDGWRKDANTNRLMISDVRVMAQIVVSVHSRHRIRRERHLITAVVLLIVIHTLRKEIQLMRKYKWAFVESLAFELNFWLHTIHWLDVLAWIPLNPVLNYAKYGWLVLVQRILSSSLLCSKRDF